MSRTVLSDLLGFLVLVFCPCKLQPMIPSFSRASIPSQTVMPCNLTLTILSVGPNHLGSYLISLSVNTSVSPAKNHPYSPPILSLNAFGSCDTEKDLGVWVSSNLTSDKQVTEQCAKANKLLGFVSRASRPGTSNASYTLSLYRPVPSRLRNLSMVETAHWLTKAS